MPALSFARSVARVVVFASLIAGAVGCASRDEEILQADLVISGGTVIDPGSKAVIKDALIAVQDGKIIAFAKRSAAKFEAKRTIDATGKFVLPAFTDMHVHWGNGTFAENANLVETTLSRSLYYGVTRILNMGSNAASPAEIDEFRGKLANGTWQGPAIYAVGSLLTVPGSHPTTTIYSPEVQKQIAAKLASAPEQGPIDLMPIRAVTLVRSTDDARSEVKRLAKWGASAIKLTIESGPGPFGDDHPQMSEDIVRAAVEQAHSSNLPVVAHVSSRDELEVCLRADVDAAAHAIITGPFDAQLHQQMGAAKFFYIVTLDLYDGFLNWSANPDRMKDAFLRETLSDAEVASMEKSPLIFKREVEFFGKPGIQPIFDHVRASHDAGAILLTGTDTGNPFAFPGYGVHQELSLMVAAGIAPMDALAATTANPAKFFKEEQQWGSIGTGQAADLLILDGDPIADIANTRRIAHVIQRGVPIDRTKLKVRSDAQ